jgi:hypothetical protein
MQPSRTRSRAYRIAGSLRAWADHGLGERWRGSAISLRLDEVAPKAASRHRLAGLEAAHDQLAVTGHADADDEHVDVAVRRHLGKPVEPQLAPNAAAEGWRCPREVHTAFNRSPAARARAKSEAPAAPALQTALPGFPRGPVGHVFLPVVRPCAALSSLWWGRPLVP